MEHYLSQQKIETLDDNSLHLFILVTKIDHANICSIVHLMELLRPPIKTCVKRILGLLILTRIIIMIVNTHVTIDLITVIYHNITIVLTGAKLPKNGGIIPWPISC